MGDFERTFGAGADVDAIIDGYSYTRQREPFDTQWIDFYFFVEAKDFVIKNPGSMLTRSNEVRISDDAGIARPGFRVFPSKQKKYFRFTDMISEHCEAEPAEFVITIPSCPELKDPDFRPTSDWQKETDRETFDHLSNFVSSSNGVTYYQAINRQPFDFETIKSNLKSASLGLYQVSECLCLVVYFDDESVYPEAGLFTEDGCTTLIHGEKDKRIYRLLA